MYFLNLPDYAKLDIAICDIQTKQQLAEKMSNSGSSTWFPLSFDANRKENNSKMIKWFVDKRIIKHQNIDIYNCEVCATSSATMLVDLLKGLDIRSIYSVSLHHCKIGDKQSIFCFIDNIYLFSSLFVLTFVMCTKISDEIVQHCRKSMKHMEVFVKAVSSRNSLSPDQPREIELIVQMIHGEDKGKPVYMLFLTFEQNSHDLRYFLEGSFATGVLKQFDGLVKPFSFIMISC